MKLIKCLGSPVGVLPPLEAAGDTAEFYLSIHIASHYTEGSQSHIILKRDGKVVYTETIPAIQTTYGILHRLLFLPVIYWSYGKIISRAVRKWPEARDATFMTTIWSFALVGLWLRRRGLVRKLVYWMWDYYPDQGSWDWRAMNFLARRVGRYVVGHADDVWYLTKPMYDLYVTPTGERLTTAPEMICPLIFMAYPEVHGRWNVKQSHRFVYLGLVRRGQGLDIILPALAQVKKLWTDVFLDVIGAGPHLDDFKAMAASLGIEGSVNFHGFIEDEHLIHEIIGNAAAGFSLYDSQLVPHARYAINSKVFVYVGCGTPVIVNNAGASYSYILEGKAGVEVSYNQDSLAQSMLKISSDFEAHLSYRAAAKRLAAEFQKEADRFTLIVKESCR